jgi:hypothetical protein
LWRQVSFFHFFCARVRISVHPESCRQISESDDYRGLSGKMLDINKLRRKRAANYPSAATRNILCPQPVVYSQEVGSGTSYQGLKMGCKVQGAFWPENVVQRPGKDPFFGRMRLA